MKRILLNTNRIICRFTVLLIFVSILLLCGCGLFSKKLPASTGKDVNVLISELESMNYDLIIDEESEFNENVARGLVSRISPVSGTKVKKGEAVTIYISKGKPITISDYRGTNSETVKGMLSGLGLIFECSEEYSEEIGEQKVIRTDPAAGEVVEEGTKVSLVVSLGSQYKELPVYTEVLANDFEHECDRLGLKYSVTEEFSDEVEEGYVISCNHSEGERLLADKDVVDIVVSKGPGVIIPELIGTNVAKAEKELEDIGLTYTISETYSDEKKESVIRTDPGEGTTVGMNSTVALTVSKGTQEAEFKENCETASYDDLIRNPSTYKTKQIKLKVKISKVENDTLLGFKYGETVWAKYQGNEMVITDGRDNKEPGFRAGDTVTIYGYGNGTSTINVKQKEYQGSLLLGFSYNKTVDSYDIPNIKAVYVDF